MLLYRIQTPYAYRCDMSYGRVMARIQTNNDGGSCLEWRGPSFGLVPFEVMGQHADERQQTN